MTRRRRQRPSSPANPVQRAFEQLELSSKRLLKVLPAPHQLACARGCAHCCHQRVSLTPLELFELAAGLRQSLDPQALAALVADLREAAERVRGLSADQHRGARCPLLASDGSCRGYAHRPLLCRGANSLDAKACAQPGAAIPTYLQLSEAAQSAQEQLDDASFERSSRRQMLELSCALAIALDQPDAELRWREGEDLFADAAHAWLEAGELRHWSRP